MFVKELQIPRIFKPVIESNPLVNPYISLPGGRCSGKSYTVGVKAILRALESPIKILFTREFQNSIKDSSYQVLVDTIKRIGVEHLFHINKTEIFSHNGSKISFKGLKTNISSIKSFEDVSLCVVEEAENISEESWDALVPTIRSQGSQIIVIFNPNSASDPTYKRWVVDPLPGTLVIHSTYKDNPYLTDKTKAEILFCKETDPVKYRNIYLGECISQDEEALIRLEWFEAALNAHTKLNFQAEGIQVVGYDAADGGKDPSALVHRHGSVIKSIKQMVELSLKDSVREVYYHCIANNVTHVNYDVIGVGVGAKPYFDQLDPTSKIVLTPFDARHKASKDKYMDTHKGCDYFKNRRAEEIIKLADRFKNTFLALRTGAYIDPSKLISIDTTFISEDIIDKLRFECTNIREKKGSSYRTIESKEDMKARLLKSPNLFDSLFYSFAPIDHSNNTTVQLNFTKWV